MASFLSDMQLDAARSRLAIYTEAEGLFSALAHDLELLAAELEGTASESSAEVRVRAGSVRVSGVMKRGKLDPTVLSAGDRDAIERQVRADVLRGDVSARGTLAGGRATVEVMAPSGRATVVCDVSVSSEGNGKRARGRAEVSLAALGAPPVKGPMGAFRVKDQVRVEFDLVFA